MTTKPDYRFKLIYAIGMIMVIAGHMETGVNLTLGGWFPYLGLHMPLFMFASGYFYKDSAADNPGAYILKKVKSLIVPLYIYNLIYGLIVFASGYAGFHIGNPLSLYDLTIGPITDGHQFEYNMGGWFVIPLFMVEVYYVLLRKLINLGGNSVQLSNSLNPGESSALTQTRIGSGKRAVPEWVYLVTGLVLGLCGNELARRGFNTGWWLVLVRMLYFIPFYSLGVFYKRVLEEYDRKIPGMVVLPVVFGIKLLIHLYYGRSLSYAPSWCTFKENAFMPLIVGILGIAVWVRIAGILEPVLGKNRLVNLIADNTYSIMINQFMGFMIVKGVYAMICRFTPYLQDFDMNAFRSDIWYCYLPKGMGQMGIFYMLAGIFIPIGIQAAENRFLSKLRATCGTIE